MLGTLFLKECKALLRSTTYYIYVLCLAVFFLSQMGTFEGVSKPVEGQESYGMGYSDDPNEIMEGTLEKLIREYSYNEYATYPFGFIKEVKLNESEQKQVFDTIDYFINADSQELQDFIEDKTNLTYEEFIEFGEDVSYEEFEEKMQEIDDLLGGGSDYAKGNLYSNAYVDITYEQALEEYNSIVYKDEISAAYARLFSDYMGIVLAILPVFLAVTRVLRDKRAKATGVIYSRITSSSTIVLSRYFATVCMAILPVIILSIAPTFQCIYCAHSNGVSGDWFAFLKVIGGWLLPTVLVTLSVGFFVTELTQGPLAILVQVIWWFASVMMNTGGLVGTVGMNLVPRFNSFGEHDIFVEIYPVLVKNRIIYTTAGILLILLTIWLYDKKRKGEVKFDGTLLNHRKG